MLPTLDRARRAIESTPLIQELPVTESSPPSSFPMSINANNRHLISYSYLTTSNWILPVCKSQSGLTNPRIISTNLVVGSQCALPSTPLPLVLGQPYPRLPFLHQNANVNFPPMSIAHESLAHLPPCCPHACLIQNGPALEIPHPRHHLAPHKRDLS